MPYINNMHVYMFIDLHTSCIHCSLYCSCRVAGREGLAPATYLSSIDPQDAEAVKEEELLPLVCHSHLWHWNQMSRS